tara:strand:+ start:4294 stop:4818 length:525 start_codon:yes stop_codon:yes gene_type:complete
MYKYYILLIFIFKFFFLNIAYSNEKIAYLDIDFIVSNSLAGKSIAEQVQNNRKIKLEKFNKIERELKNEENEIMTQRNILSKEEFENKINILKQKIDDYRKEKKNEVDKLNNQRYKLTKNLLDKLNPLLANYSSENSLFMIIDKKSIVIGKKELDITEDILNLLNETIKKVELN